MNKSTARKLAIKELIKQYPIENQTSIVQMLKEKYAIETNQSIVSRDLHELNVSKINYKDCLIYELQESNPSKEILKLCVIDIVYNEVMIVIQVLPGLASFVGDYLDIHHESIGILGTIAGENMIFVTPISIKQIDKTVKNICALLSFKPQPDRRKA